MRIRDRSSSSSVTMLHGWYHRSNGSWWAGFPSHYPGILHQIDTMTDVVTPQFYDKRRHGAIILNPMTKTKISQSVGSSGALTAYSTPSDPDGSGYRWLEAGVYLIPPDPYGRLTSQVVKEEIARCETIAITAAYSSVGNASAESLVAIGEMKETLGFLNSPFALMTKLVKRAQHQHSILSRDIERYNVRLYRWNARNKAGKKVGRKPTLPKRNFKLGRFAVTDISSLWLGFRYGVMPLIYDVQDHLAAFLKQSFSPARVTSRGKQISRMSVDDAPDMYGPGQAGDVHVREGNLSFSVTSRAGVLYEPRIETAVETFGLTLDRIPSALWELVPLSFVADWAVNVSDALNALTAHIRSQKILGAWVTSTIEWQYLVTRTMTATIGGQSGHYHFREEGKHVVRRSVSLLDIGLDFRVKMNEKRWTDALALLHQFSSSSKH